MYIAFATGQLGLVQLAVVLTAIASLLLHVISLLSYLRLYSITRNLGFFLTRYQTTSFQPNPAEVCYT